MSDRINNCVGLLADNTLTKFTDLCAVRWGLWEYITEALSFKQHEVELEDEEGDYTETKFEISLSDFIDIMLREGLRYADGRGTLFMTFSSSDDILFYFFDGLKPESVFFDYG